MRAKLKYALIGLMGLGFTASLQTEAFAWGCYAASRSGATGWSYNYPNRRAAVRRALYECSIRSYTRCRLSFCRPNG